MHFIKTFTVVFMLTSLTAYSQLKRDFSAYWVGNLPTSPLGLGFNFAKKENKFGVFNYYVSGTGHKGTSVSVEENTGIYQLNTWGNRATGNINISVVLNYFAGSFGPTYKLYQKDEIILRFYGGLIINKTKTDTYKSKQAEDVTSGVNVVGYYWLADSETHTQETKVGVCIGLYASLKFVHLGLGFDSQPNGVNLSIGFKL